MIAGKATDTVYFSEILLTDKRFTKTCNALTELLEKHSIKYEFLNATKDIWCRDYMPIQIEKGEFVQFRYEPSYLKDDLEPQSNPKEVFKADKIVSRFSKINIDGGNVINWSDRAIITDRIFDENPGYTSKTKLLADLENLLGAEIIVIPQIRFDMTGYM